MEFKVGQYVILSKKGNFYSGKPEVGIITSIDNVNGFPHEIYHVRTLKGSYASITEDKFGIVESYYLTCITEYPNDYYTLDRLLLELTIIRENMENPEEFQIQISVDQAYGELPITNGIYVDLKNKIISLGY